MDSREFLELFTSESREHLEGLGALLAKARRQELAQEEINDLFRHAHSLKGMAASMGFQPIARLSHAMEDLLHGWRERGAAPSAATLDLLLRATDRLSAQVETVAAGGEAAVEADLVSALHAVAPANHAALEDGAPAAGAFGSGALGAGAPGAAADVPPPGAAGADDGLPRLEIEVVLRPGTPLPAARAMVILKRLAEQARVLGCSPDPAAMATKGFAGRFRVSLATTLPGERLASLVAALPDVSECRPLAAHAAATPSVAAAPSAAASGAESAPRPEALGTIRVPTEKMDRLLDGVGELILHRERLKRALVVEPGSEAQGFLEALERTMDLLRDTVMAMRLIPFASLVPRLQRTVRDLARRLGKEVELEVRGTDVALDRSVLEETMDPLEHILRNSIDHGIEDAATRRAAGKPAAGRIEIELSRRDDRVCLRASDDGRGIDPQALRRVALEKRFITREAAERLSEDEALMLITIPGLSTAVRTTDISGRGVGMDVVRTRVQKLGGRLSIRSRLGAGTTFEMDLPPAVTVTRAFLCRAAGEVYAVPVSMVQTTLNVRREAILGSQGEQVVQRGDEVVTLLPLGALLAGAAAPAPAPATPALLYRVGRRAYALAVDEILGETEIVVKPLKHPLELLPQYAGAAILNDGRIALILDPANLALASRAA